MQKHLYEQLNKKFKKTQLEDWKFDWKLKIPRTLFFRSKDLTDSSDEFSVLSSILNFFTPTHKKQNTQSGLWSNNSIYKKKIHQNPKSNQKQKYLSWNQDWSKEKDYKNKSDWSHRKPRVSEAWTHED